MNEPMTHRAENIEIRATRCVLGTFRMMVFCDLSAKGTPSPFRTLDDSCDSRSDRARVLLSANPQEC